MDRHAFFPSLIRLMDASNVFTWYDIGCQLSLQQKNNLKYVSMQRSLNIC